MTDAVTVDTSLNSSQSGGPAIPNVDRQPAPVVETKTPEQIAAEAAAAGKTPEQLAAEAAAAEAKPADAPALEGEDAEPEAKLPTSADADADGVVHFAPTGDSGMDMALAFVGKLGIGMDHPAMLATLNNDFSQIRAVLATMGDKAVGYDAMVTLAEEANRRFNEKNDASAKAINTAVGSVLGESQTDVLAWASKNASPEEKKSINAMLRADPVQARAAANILLQAFQQAGGTVVAPASATRDPSTVVPNTQSLGPISNKEFAVETGKLVARHGERNYRNTPEYAALARRLG